MSKKIRKGQVTSKQPELFKDLEELEYFAKKSTRSDLHNHYTLKWLKNLGKAKKEIHKNYLLYPE